MRRCVVNFAQGGSYPKGQRRLREACARLGVDFLGYTDYPPGCPDHRHTPYGFKPYCVLDAFRRGYGSVLWIDASGDLRKDPAPIFGIMEAEGAFVSDNPGWVTGQWATDACLAHYGITRDEAMRIPHASALVVGFCRGVRAGEALFEAYLRGANLGLYRGAWSNADGSCSADPRCLGHRHDQTVLSIEAHLAGLPFRPMGEHLDYGAEKTAIVCAYPAA